MQSGGTEGRDAHFGEPAAHVIPPDAHDVAAFERPAAGMVPSPISQQLAVPVAEVVDEALCLGSFRALCARRGWALFSRRYAVTMVPLNRVATDKALVSFTDDPCLASPEQTTRVGQCAKRKVRNCMRT